MLRIRLRRVGKKGKPSYRIVVAEANAPRDGAYLEWIGNYDPMVDPPAITLKQDRATKWLSHGAQPSDAVRRILDRAGVLDRTPDCSSAASVAVAAEPPAGQVTEEKVEAEPPVVAAAVDAASVDAAPGDEAAGEAPAEEASDEAPAE